MNQWVDVTSTFSESQRHYKNTYLEICEVFDEVVEISLFSSEVGPYEIYFSFGIMYGIVYTDKENSINFIPSFPVFFNSKTHNLPQA